MNLNEPCFDSVLAIDSQLQKLQTEVASMGSEFANYRPPQQSRRPATQTAGSTPSPEIEEERKTNKSCLKQPRVSFQERPVVSGNSYNPSSRDILRQ